MGRKRNTAKLIDPQGVRQCDLVRILGSNRATLSEWEAGGMPGVRGAGRGKRYNLYEILRWLKTRWLGGAEPGTPSKRSAEIDLLVARKVHLELKTRLASGELIPRNSVEEAIIARCLMTKHGLIALRRTLAPAVLELGVDATIEDAEKLIWEYTRALMDAWSRPEITVRDGERFMRIRINFPDGVKSNENENTTDPRGK